MSERKGEGRSSPVGDSGGRRGGACISEQSSYSSCGESGTIVVLSVGLELIEDIIILDDLFPEVDVISGTLRVNQREVTEGGLGNRARRASFLQQKKLFL